jgi:hypothetical protein
MERDNCWTAYEDEILSNCIALRLSAGQTSQRLIHRSRNACIGRAFRLGLSFNCTDAWRSEIARQTNRYIQMAGRKPL